MTLTFVKKSLVLITSYFFLLATTALQAAPADLWSVKNNNSQPLLVANQQLQLIPKIIEEKTANYTISVRYPQIVGGTLTEAAKQFNQLSQTFVNNTVATFKNDLAQSAGNTDLPNTQSYLKLNYDIAGFESHSQQTEYLSVRFNISLYERGMAHPSSQTSVLNFDLGHNQTLSLNDLFKPNSGFLDVISEACIKQLQANHLPDDILKAGAGPSVDHYKNWNLTLKGILITFDEAQVAPRAFGKQEVLLPYVPLTKFYTKAAACTVGVVNCDGT